MPYAERSESQATLGSDLKATQKEDLYRGSYVFKLTSSLGMNFTCTLALSPGSKTPEVGWISKIRVFGIISACSFRLKYFGMCLSIWVINVRQLDHSCSKQSWSTQHSQELHFLSTFQAPGYVDQRQKGGMALHLTARPEDIFQYQV